MHSGLVARDKIIAPILLSLVNDTPRGNTVIILLLFGKSVQLKQNIMFDAPPYHRRLTFCDYLPASRPRAATVHRHNCCCQPPRRTAATCTAAAPGCDDVLRVPWSFECNGFGRCTVGFRCGARVYIMTLAIAAIRFWTVKYICCEII